MSCTRLPRPPWPYREQTSQYSAFRGHGTGIRRSLCGEVTNIIPERSVIAWELRALTMPEFWDLHRRILACFEAGVVATGCTYKVVPVEPVYEALLQDTTLGELWNEGMEVL